MKLYAELRAIMIQNNADQKYLAQLLNKSTGYVGLRFTGKGPWNQNDQYTIMDEFNIPYDQMHIIFPKDGHRVKPQKENKFISTIEKRGIKFVFVQPNNVSR